MGLGGGGGGGGPSDPCPLRRRAQVFSCHLVFFPTLSCHLLPWGVPLFVTPFPLLGALCTPPPPSPLSCVLSLVSASIQSFSLLWAPPPTPTISLMTPFALSPRPPEALGPRHPVHHQV